MANKCSGFSMQGDLDSVSKRHKKPDPGGAGFLCAALAVAGSASRQIVLMYEKKPLVETTVICPRFVQRFCWQVVALS